jgi:type II secretory pathway pseudopilin PulG
VRPSIRRPEWRSRAGWAIRRLARDDGFTLFEVLIAAVVLVVGLLSTFSLLDASLKASASTRAREGATNLAREILEDARTLAFSQISPNSIVGQLQAMHGLENAGSGTWQIVRRGVTYTVVVKECAIDDPKDGSGKHENAFKENPFCKDPGETEGTADAQPEDLKRITAEVSWTAIGRKPVVKEVETLTAAGESPGLSASELKLAEPKAGVGSPTAPVISTEPGSGKLVFSVQSPVGTAAMEWTLDGVRQTTPPALVKGTEWQFSWPIPLPEVSDGAYKVSVQAIDESGVYGPPVSITVTLIRTVPAAPKVKYGGFNEVLVSGVKKKVVELLWEPNTERNVIGYRTYEPTPGSALACPESLSALSLQSSCADFLATAPEPSSANLTYSVVALYRKAEGEVLSSAVSQGPAGTFTLSKTIQTPNEPVGPLKGTKTEEGVKLNWSAPAGGPEVAFYRVYRGSQNYTGRYAVVPPSTTEFVDTNATTEHTYWVTAVSTTMTESPFCCGEGVKI